MNIRNVDLNLLLVLRELLLEKNTVKVGAKLGLSQPAVSHSLKRLRDAFGDELMVRASRGLVPTRRALELEPQIQDLIKNAEALFSEPKKFNPKESKLTFRIATTDYMEQLILPGLLAILETEAPGCTVITRPTYASLPKTEMEEGNIDVAIAGFYKDLPDNFYKQNIIEDNFVCVARRGNAIFKGPLTLKKYADAKHMLISMDGDMKSRAQALLKKQGLDQQFAAGVSSFNAPGWILTRTDLLLTCPRKLAESFQVHLPVEIKELPFQLEKISIVQAWHSRNHRDEAQVWFRSLLKQVCSSL